MAIYGLDWDGNNRSQRLDLIDAGTNALLDSRSISTFHSGEYLVWDLRGHVKITVVKTGARTAVVSGLYFGGPRVMPTPTPTPTATPTPTPSPTPGAGKKVGHSRGTGQAISNEIASIDESSEPGGVSTSQLTTSILNQLQGFAAETQDAYSAFNSERQTFPAAGRIDPELSSAIVCAQQSYDSALSGDIPSTRNHLREAIDHLVLSDVLINYGDIANPIDVSSYMVRQHYVDFLNREPDQSGSDFWVAQIDSCGNDLNCVEVKRINVSAAFFLSIEFRQTGFFAYQLYKSSYGRMPTLQEFVPDHAAVARGVVVGENGWDVRLSDNKQSFLQAWVQRSEFQSRYAGLSNEQYLDALIANTQGSLTEAEREGLLQDLANGQSRATVLGEIAENPTFSRRELNSAFVLMQYFGYLGRDPDVAGFNFWLDKLNEFDGNFQSAEMVKAFLRSTEYRLRFGQ